MGTRLGAVTIGQSPRTDIIPDLRTVLGEELEIVEAGALDGLSAGEVAQLAPDDGDRMLVTRLRDGRGVRIAHRHIIPLLHRRLQDLAPRVDAILLLCTGSFEPFHVACPVVYPERLMLAAASAVAPSHIGVVTPDAGQMEEQQRRWQAVAGRISVLPASPYASAELLPGTAAALAARSADLIVLDSLGYSLAMKTAVRRVVSRPVLLPRTVLARAAAELLG